MYFCPSSSTSLCQDDRALGVFWTGSMPRSSKEASHPSLPASSRAALSWQGIAWIVFGARTLDSKFCTGSNLLWLHPIASLACASFLNVYWGLWNAPLSVCARENLCWTGWSRCSRIGWSAWGRTGPLSEFQRSHNVVWCNDCPNEFPWILT